MAKKKILVLIMTLSCFMMLQAAKVNKFFNISVNGKNLYDLCMNQNFQFVHEIQHWLRETHVWDGLYVNHRL